MTNASADHRRSLRAWLGRREVQVGFVLVVAALGSLPWLVHRFTDPVLHVGDGAIYQLTAYSLLAGEGYTYLGEPVSTGPPLI